MRAGRPVVDHSHVRFAHVCTSLLIKHILNCLESSKELLTMRAVKGFLGESIQI